MDELQTINSPFDGRVSQLSVDDGDTVNAGDVLLAPRRPRRCGGQPENSVSTANSTWGPMGPDVLQLERILFESGYNPGSIDTLYTEDTRTALRRWQIALWLRRGHPGTGRDRGRFARRR